MDPLDTVKGSSGKFHTIHYHGLHYLATALISFGSNRDYVETEPKSLLPAFKLISHMNHLYKPEGKPWIKKHSEAMDNEQFPYVTMLLGCFLAPQGAHIVIMRYYKSTCGF